MYKCLAVLSVLLAIYVQTAPAVRCSNINSFGRVTYWNCAFTCCDFYAYTGCCNNYWYAWTISSVVILLCLCSCAGVGGYRYRRRYYYTTTNAPVATTVVTQSNVSSAAYQPAAPQQPIAQSGYQPYAPPKDAPPPYNPAVEKPPTYY